MDNNLITNTACPICKTGKMKFDRLVVKRFEYGDGKKFLTFACNSCGYKIFKPFMQDKNKQLEFNI